MTDDQCGPYFLTAWEREDHERQKRGLKPLGPPGTSQDPRYGLGSGHNASGLSNACEQDEGA
jgi:hypothetical protein